MSTAVCISKVLRLLFFKYLPAGGISVKMKGSKPKWGNFGHFKRQIIALFDQL